MNRTIWQPRLSIFFLCAGIVVSLAQGSFPHGAASHERKTTRGMAGSPEQVPALETQQVYCANARPTFQESAAPVRICATAPPSEPSELVIFNKPDQPHTELPRAHSGRAPPAAFSR